MVVAASGSVEHEHDRGRGAAAVRQLRRRGSADSREPARFVGGTYIERQDLEQAHLALAMEGLPQRDPQLFSLQVFTNILGGGMSSRLFQEVREIRGLCYSISSFHMAYSRHRLLRDLCRHRRQRCAGTDAGRGRSDRARRRHSITEAEIARAKAQMKASLLMALESSGARAEQIARQMMVYGRPLPLPEIVAKIEAVTVESTQAAGLALLARSRLAIAGARTGTRH